MSFTTQSQNTEEYQNQLKQIDSLIGSKQIKGRRKEFPIIMILRYYKSIDYLVIQYNDEYLENWWTIHSMDFPNLQKLEDSNQLEFYHRKKRIKF